MTWLLIGLAIGFVWRVFVPEPRVWRGRPDEDDYS